MGIQVIADDFLVCVYGRSTTPRNSKLLQEFLGMIQYLSKFLPRLSTITEPLRQLLHQDAEWKWLQEHEDAVTTLKGLISTAPVLRNFDCTKQISLQCDASESGLGYAILQGGNQSHSELGDLPQRKENTLR